MTDKFTKQLKEMIEHYRFKGDRVDEVLYQEVNKVIDRVQELEEDKEELYKLNQRIGNKAWEIEQQNKRYREAFRQIKLQILFEGTIELHRENIIEIIDEVLESEE